MPDGTPARIDPLAAPSIPVGGPLASNNPAAGGWAPPKWFPYVSGLLSTVLGGLGAVILQGGPLTLKSIIAAVLVGLGSGFAGFSGAKSAGPRS